MYCIHIFIQTFTEILKDFMVFPEVCVAHKIYQTSRHFSRQVICSYLFCSPPLLSLPAYLKEHKQTLRKGRWPEGSYTKIDSNGRVTQNL